MDGIIPPACDTWPAKTMYYNKSPQSLNTATEIAKFLNVDARTVHYWAEEGKIATAFREGRSVELVVLALSLTFGPAFPRIPRVDLDSITRAEIAELRKLCAAYAADLETLGTPQECAAYAEGVLAAARLVAKGV